MFNNEQITSYKNITPPADLKQKVQLACKSYPQPKKLSAAPFIYRLAPMAACLVLFLTMMSMVTGRNDTMILKMGNTVLDSQSVEIPADEGVSRIQSFTSHTDDQRTFLLSVNKDVEILSADGNAVCENDGLIVWTVKIPEDDTTFELLLHSGNRTYSVPLQYHVINHRFTIRCEAE